MNANYRTRLSRVAISCLLVAIFMCSNVVWAFAANVTSTSPIPQTNASLGAEFDFSATDSLDKYDVYEKSVTESGVEYVRAFSLNSINMVNPAPVDQYRYGAFLRHQGEIQNYMIQNLPYNKQINSNVLTVYADPEVEFDVLDASNNIVMSSNGLHGDQVEYFNKSTDGDNVVYYIELKPAKVGQGSWIVQFTTESTTVRPHYSFWFGNPLVKVATALGNAFAVSIQAPNRESIKSSVNAPGSIPSRAWVSKIIVDRTSVVGVNNLYNKSSGALQVTLANGQELSKIGVASAPTLTIDANPTATLAAPARAMYKFNLNQISWQPHVRPGTSFLFEGRMSVEYIYAFGA